LLNSHDGTSSYQIMSGVFRFVCSNGLIAGDMFNNIKVRHSGNVVGDVIEGATRVLDDAKQIGSRIDEYKSITLDYDEQQAFARSALQIRWGDEKPVQASRLLQPSRWQDRQDDLWTVYNRVQENMMKGGVPGRSATGRRTTTRAVGGVSENVKLNKALWTLADTMAALKLDKATDQFIAAHEHAYL
jgi:Rad3-related DNA helicase